jgi:N-acetylglucosamine-6-phosphate deacetylase
MKEIWIAPDHMFDGQDVVTGQAVRIVDGHVIEVAAAPNGARRIKGCLTPGFVDLQVKGGGGVMLNTMPTRAGILKIASAHRSFGTVAVMPTVITDQAEVLDNAADAVIAAKADQGIVGLHIEGPHISLKRRGTHKSDHIRPMDSRTMDVVARLRRENIAVMITIAPEATTNAQIAALNRLGAIVSLGHTDATADVIDAAITAGAVCATHVFNAMSPMTSRAPGAVGAILNSHVYGGLICDGYHVDDRMVQIALRARPADDLLFLVSDAMATVGGPDTFDLYGQQVLLEGGRLINVEGSLAGAHVTQAEGVARLVKQIGAPLGQALRMAITVPARVVGQTHLTQIEGRLLRDLVVLTDELKVSDTLANIQADLLAHDAAE